MALLGFAGAAQAEVGVQFTATTRGQFVDENGGVSNDVLGASSTNPDGSHSSHLGCFGSDENEIGCTISDTAWPLDDWWDRPYPHPTWAAGQAYADFGTLQARSVVVVDPAGGTASPRPRWEPAPTRPTRSQSGAKS